MKDEPPFYVRVMPSPELELFLPALVCSAWMVAVYHFRLFCPIGHLVLCGFAMSACVAGYLLHSYIWSITRDERNQRRRRPKSSRHPR